MGGQAMVPSRLLLSGGMELEAEHQNRGHGWVLIWPLWSIGVERGLGEATQLGG